MRHKMLTQRTLFVLHVMAKKVHCVVPPLQQTAVTLKVAGDVHTQAQ